MENWVLGLLTLSAGERASDDGAGLPLGAGGPGADLIYWLRVAAGLAAALLALRFGLRLYRSRAWTPAPPDPREAAVDKAVAAFLPAVTQERPLVPRTLPASPFSAGRDLTKLGREIEIAAQACVRLSRTVGLISFDFPMIEAIAREQGARAADEAGALLADAFRSSIRATDHVAWLGRSEMLVCICLLESMRDLRSIAARLMAVAQARGLLAAADASTGFAIYPLNGYDGSELIAAAQAARRQSGLNAPTVANPTLLARCKRKRSRRLAAPAAVQRSGSIR